MTYSHIANATLPSALLLFTSVFGMDTGGSTALSSLDISGLCIDLNKSLSATNYKPGDDLVSHSECYTIIGVTAFHFCVRYGYRWFNSTIFTRHILLKNLSSFFSSFSQARPSNLLGVVWLSLSGH